MKTFNELTDLEVYNLTSQEIEKYKLLALAEAGVKIIKPPTSPELHEIKAPTEIYYKVDHNKFDDVYFKTNEDAEKFMNFISNSKIYRTLYEGNQYNFKYCVEDHNEDWSGKERKMSINSVQFYTREDVVLLQEQIKSNENIEKKYKELKKEYDDNLTEYNDIVSPIDDRVIEVQRWYNEADRLYTKYLEYKTIDEEKAWDFFTKAYTVDEKQKEYILNK